jgi:hypothetical protein
MTAATMIPVPVRDALAWVLDDAIRYREPAREGCCEGGEACQDHASDQAVAGAVSALMAAVESAQDEGQVIASLREHCPLVLAAIAACDAEGGARDDG